MTDLDIVPVEPPALRLSAGQAAEWGQWVRDVMRAALTEGVDYGWIIGSNGKKVGTKPTMFKSGAEMLLRAAGLGFTIARIDDEDSREHLGVTYRCTVHRPDGVVVAVCDGYMGHDDAGRDQAPWNTIVKMAQKRAMVGAALNATASSGLFNADLDDDPPPRQVGAPPVGSGIRELLADLLHELDEEAFDRVEQAAKGRIPNLRGPKFNTDHAEILATLIRLERAVTDAVVEDDDMPADVHDTQPEATQHGPDDSTRYDPND